MKFFITLSSLFVFITGIFIGFIYFYIKNDALQINTLQKDKLLNELVYLTKDALASNDLGNFKKAIEALQKVSPLGDVKLFIKKHTFDDTLLFKRVSFSHSFWNIIDVSMDNAYGDIESDGTAHYILLLSKEAYTLDTITIKFQVANEEVVHDFLLPWHIQTSILSDKKSDGYIFKEIDTNEFILSLSYTDVIPHKDILDKVYYCSFIIIGFGILFFILNYLLYIYFIRRHLSFSIVSLSQFIKQALERKVVTEASLVIMHNDLANLQIFIIELVKRYVSASNELSISKDIIFQKERSDELTGLPNKKSFENDLKYMFISNKNGYVIYLKIDKIGLFTKNYGPEIVDGLIEDFAKMIQYYFNTSKKNLGGIYRFFGGEFAILLYDPNPKNIEYCIEEIISLTNTLSDKYYFFDRTVYYGATPFDHYGTIESIVQSAQEAYEIALTEKTTFYYIVDSQKQMDLNVKLEETVKDIISRNDFVLQYFYDTYSFGDSPQLIMQEVSPLLVDGFTYETIPSGKFISIAEKLSLIIEFDKAMIEKILQHIELGELTHKIGVVLSITSIANFSFNLWLESLITTNKYIHHIVFSAAGYSVASNIEIFKDFNTMLKKHGMEMIIKKYDPVDLNLENLENIAPSYVRIEKSLCQDFKKDSTKQHAIKQILLLTERINIKVFGDSVKNDNDYAAFEMLGFFGTSR